MTDALRITIRAGRIAVHGSGGERAPMPDEIELIREAIEPKPLPLWLDLGVVGAGIAALAYWSFGISQGGSGS